MKDLDKRLGDYKKRFKPNETTMLLVIFIEVMDEISVSLENISNKMWE